jgi:hypothetical protein
MESASLLAGTVPVSIGYLGCTSSSKFKTGRFSAYWLEELPCPSASWSSKLNTGLFTRFPAACAIPRPAPAPSMRIAVTTTLILDAFTLSPLFQGFGSNTLFSDLPTSAQATKGGFLAGEKGNGRGKKGDLNCGSGVGLPSATPTSCSAIWYSMNRPLSRTERGDALGGVNRCPPSAGNIAARIASYLNKPIGTPAPSSPRKSG